MFLGGRGGESRVQCPGFRVQSSIIQFVNGFLSSNKYSLVGSIQTLRVFLRINAF